MIGKMFRWLGPVLSLFLLLVYFPLGVIWALTKRYM